jgi:hypothetical protein
LNSNLILVSGFDFLFSLGSDNDSEVKLGVIAYCGFLNVRKSVVCDLLRCESAQVAG